MVVGNDDFHAPGTGFRDYRGELGHRAQFHVNQSSKGQKLRKKVTTAGEIQAMGSAFRWMADGHQQRSLQPGEGPKDRRHVLSEGIHANLKKIDLIRTNFERPAQRTGRVHCTNNLRSCI